MKVVEFPKKKRKCECRYVYRMVFNPDEGVFGSQIAKDMGDNKVKLLTLLTGFEQEMEAEAAAFGFMEALHYVNSGGER